MNADASPAVDVDGTFGVVIPRAFGLSMAVLVTGLVLGVLGVALLLVGLLQRGRPTPPAPSAPAARIGRADRRAGPGADAPRPRTHRTPGHRAGAGVGRRFAPGLTGTEAITRPRQPAAPSKGEHHEHPARSQACGDDGVDGARRQGLLPQQGLRRG